MKWEEPANDKIVEMTAKALKENGFETIVVNNAEEAKKKVLELIPPGSEVYQGASVTLQEIGITHEIEESGKYISLRKQMHATADKDLRGKLMKEASNTTYMLGSANAITTDGHIINASASGSQLAPYVFGAQNVIFVVGTQKIVKNLDEAMQRIKEYIFPLENERVKVAYGIPGSSINKILIQQKERPGRIKVILVKQKLGF